MIRQETRLTLYGGVDEIGGNKILLEDRDTACAKFMGDLKGKVVRTERTKQYTM